MGAKEDFTYDDMIGFKVLKFHELWLKAIGHRLRLDSKLTTKEKMARTFGFLVSMCNVFFIFATLNEIRGNDDVQDLQNVGVVFVESTTAVSMLHKYSVFISQEKGVGLLTVWMRNLKQKNKQLQIKPTRTEVILKKFIRLFYLLTHMAPVLMFVMPLIRGKPYAVRIPFVQRQYPYLIFPLVMVSFFSLSWEIALTATMWLNALVTFQGEIERQNSQWSNMKVDPNHKGQFQIELKKMVTEHVELHKTFKYLKNLNNSMFGYQVFTTLLCTSAMIYGGSKFLRQAASQVLPVFTPAIVEFVLICWLGEQITSGFEEFHKSIHRTNWEDAALSEKKSITIILEFTKRRIVLTGFTVFKTNLETFIETMRQSFSLYTLLQSLS